MKVIVFSGPSLPPPALSCLPEFSWRPPVRRGDFEKAVEENPHAIAVVDGYFETIPTVWHKEILAGLKQGIRVYGAASIGALRAVELADYGMIGVGEVFAAFRAGILQDDDEVALLHGPAELGFPQLTDALVDIRATLAAAVELGLLGPTHAEEFVAAAKALFYKDRTYEAALRAVVRQSHAAGFQAFADALPNIRIDQKRLDALEMVDRIRLDFGRITSVLE